MLDDFFFRMRALFRRNAVETELNEELRFHFEQQVAKNMESGQTRREAERQARLRFGGLGSVLLVGPHYHRVHHSIEHAEAPFNRSRGCNFAVILPIWDVIFGTWRRSTTTYPQTGVASLSGPAVRCGYLRHQWEGFHRPFAALVHLVNRRRPDFIAALPAE